MSPKIKLKSIPLIAIATMATIFTPPLLTTFEQRDQNSLNIVSLNQETDSLSRIDTNFENAPLLNKLNQIEKFFMKENHSELFGSYKAIKKETIETAKMFLKTSKHQGMFSDVSPGAEGEITLTIEMPSVNIFFTLFEKFHFLQIIEKDTSKILVEEIFNF